MPTVSTATQTESFLGLLGYEDMLTKLYQRIKIAQANEQQYRVKIEYLEYKNQALERSLFEYELKSRQKQSERNEILLHDLITLEEQIEKQRNDVKKQHAKIEQQKRRNSAQSKSRKMSKQSQTPNNSLLTIKQQPQLQNPPTSKRPSSKQTKQINRQQSQFQSQTRKQSRRPLQTMDQNTQKMIQLQQHIEKQQKNKRIMQLQLKRLRKLNQEYSVKCRKLEKLVDVKSELYGNLSVQLNQNCSNYSNCSGLMDDDGDAGVLFH